jgi:hypothetical protein
LHTLILVFGKEGKRSNTTIARAKQMIPAILSGIERNTA